MNYHWYTISLISISACAGQNLFLCYDECVTREKVCDGTNDCMDGSDEDAQGRCGKSHILCLC